MKKITIGILIAVTVLAINLSSSAQKTVINETNEHLGGTVNPALSVFIEKVDSKTVSKAWKSLLEDNKGEVESKKNDINAADVVLPLLSATPVAVFSRITEDKTGIMVVAAFCKEGQYVCTKYLPKETELAKKIMYDFAVAIKQGMVQAELDDAKKVLENLKDKNKDLVNKKSGLENDIQSYNKKIKKSEDEIAKKPDMTAEDKAKLDKDILNYKAKIKEVEGYVKENESQQKDMEKQIDSQDKVVESLKTKLAEID